MSDLESDIIIRIALPLNNIKSGIEPRKSNQETSPTPQTVEENNTDLPTPDSLGIVGRPIIPGTLQACLDTEQTPPATYQWSIDGRPSVAGEFFHLTEEHLNKTIQCKSTPLLGGSAAEAASILYAATDSFQNISRQENENSFIKLFGNFTIHSPAPADGVLSLTSGAYALLTGGNRLQIGGKATHGGTPPTYFSDFLKHNGTANVFTTEKDFAVLVETPTSNRLLIWGSNIPVNIPYGLGNIRFTYSNRYSFAFIYRDQGSTEYKIGAAGAASNGGVIPDAVHLSLSHETPRAIYPTEAAFAVLTEAGHVFAWGNTGYGGTIDVSTRSILDTLKVTSIVTNSSAFCAIGELGELVTWGKSSDGGTIPATILENIMDDGGAELVVAAKSAFCAITRGRRKAFCWGATATGGTMSAAASELSARGNIILCKAASWAFCIVNQSGQAEAWGHAAYGGTTIPAEASSGISDISNSETAPPTTLTEAQLSIKSLFSERSGSAHETVSQQSTNTVYSDALGTIRLYANDGGFCLLGQTPEGQTRNIICWGHATYSALPQPTKQILLASKIEQIYCSNGAYCALTRQGDVEGCVVAWGSGSNDGGALPANLDRSLYQGVLQIYPIKSVPDSIAPATIAGFAARCQNGDTVFWGAAIPAAILPSE
ncbi:hypothetical protein [Pseudomonas sp. TE3610]